MINNAVKRVNVTAHIKIERKKININNKKKDNKLHHPDALNCWDHCATIIYDFVKETCRVMNMKNSRVSRDRFNIFLLLLTSAWIFYLALSSIFYT